MEFVSERRLNKQQRLQAIHKLHEVMELPTKNIRSSTEPRSSSKYTGS